MVPSRIHLINCNPTILNWILEGDLVLSQNLKIKVPNNWTEFGRDIFKFSLNAINNNPKSQIWFTYLPVEIKLNTLIGTCGFKGEPRDGLVEIGYEVSEAFRNKGYATEMVKLLINIALTSNLVNNIVAHTLPTNNPSVSVLKKCGFRFVAEIFDEDDGNLWKWNLSK